MATFIVEEMGTWGCLQTCCSPGPVSHSDKLEAKVFVMFQLDDNLLLNGFKYHPNNDWCY